jgi:hypothetical protein
MINFQTKQQQSHIKLFPTVTSLAFNNCLKEAKVRSMISTEVLYDLWNTIKFVTDKNLKGDILEFGVWKGGALEIACHAFNHFKGSNSMWGFDTFEGHPEPNPNEFNVWGLI